jgi:pimeloyl-ACP methyl ester carboxylesterase
MEDSIERRFGIPWREFDVLSAARGLSAPALVIHDGGDAEVPWSDGEALAKAWPGAEMVTTQGLGHTRIVHDADVVRRAVLFVTEGRAAKTRECR